MAKPHPVAVIVGSLRKESFTLKIANALVKLAPDTIKLSVVTLDGISFFNQDLEANPPADWLAFREKLQKSEGVLFVTPEYNRSIPGVLKNAIDIASRPWGTNSFAGKPAAVIGVSVGAQGGAMAQQHLRNVLAYLDVPTLAQPEVFIHAKDGLFAEDGSIANEGTRKFLQGFMDRYVAWVKRHR